MKDFLLSFLTAAIPVLSIVIAVAFFVYSYLAANALKMSGDSLKDGDNQTAGEALSKAGVIYLNILKASLVFLVVSLIMCFAAVNYYKKALKKQADAIEKMMKVGTKSKEASQSEGEESAPVGKSSESYIEGSISTRPHSESHKDHHEDHRESPTMRRKNEALFWN